jgi:hypothetical protein
MPSHVPVAQHRQAKIEVAVILAQDDLVVADAINAEDADALAWLGFQLFRRLMPKRATMASRSTISLRAQPGWLPSTMRARPASSSAAPAPWAKRRHSVSQVASSIQGRDAGAGRQGHGAYRLVLDQLVHLLHAISMFSVITWSSYTTM